MSIRPLTTTDYSLNITLPNTSFEDAVAMVTAALKTEGFGVLTEIDVQKTLKKKIDVDTRPYLILGACNPKLAHEAMVSEPTIGALLPCNVVLSTDDAGGVVVAAIDPVAMFSVVGRDDIAPLADEVRSRLARVLAVVEAR